VFGLTSLFGIVDVRESETVFSRPNIPAGLSTWREDGTVGMLLIAIFILVSTIFVGGEVAGTETSFASTSNTPTVNALYPPETCESAWFEASQIPSDDIQNPNEDLDPAIRTCLSLADWMSQAAKYPDLVLGREPELLLARRCSEMSMPAGLCQSLVFD